MRSPWSHKQLTNHYNHGHNVRIFGPPEFQKAVVAVLDELRAKLPTRYAEAIRAMPTLTYDASILSVPASALADGRFSIDMQHPAFRWIYLHEVGHNVLGVNHGDWSEGAANEYARAVTAELDGTPLLWAIQEATVSSFSYKLLNQ